jgi:hypothetical protein
MMTSAAQVLEVFEGCELLLDETPWTVSRLEAHSGTLELQRADCEPRVLTLRSVMNDPECRQGLLPGPPSAPGAGQPMMLVDLTDWQRGIVDLRVSHLLEVETGFRGGDPLRPGSGEPRPQFDPETTSLMQRRQAKAEELARESERNPEQARLLGLDHVSFRTLCRWERERRRFGAIGCTDGRWLRRCGPRWSITDVVREAISAVRAETLHRSKLSMATRARLIAQYVRERCGPDVPVPSPKTLARAWRELFGSGGSRQRYARSAAGVEAHSSGRPVVVQRPGQVVALDTTPLPVLVRESVFGDPVEAHLTLALDVYTHSIVAFRLTLVSDTSVDVAMVLRDVMTPLPMRPDWSEELAWPYE